MIEVFVDVVVVFGGDCYEYWFGVKIVFDEGFGNFFGFDMIVVFFCNNFVIDFVFFWIVGDFFWDVVEGEFLVVVFV